jgi:hypothetical protein
VLAPVPLQAAVLAHSLAVLRATSSAPRAFKTLNACASLLCVTFVRILQGSQVLILTDYLEFGSD